MASGKRQPSKQKRQNQNRQQRAAREARATNASARPAPTSGASGASTSSGSSGGAARSGGLFGRLRGAATAGATGAERPTRTSGVGGGARAGGARSAAAAGAATPSGDPLTDRRGQPVGYRAALTGLLAAVAAVVVSFFVSQHVNGQGDVYTSVKVVADWSRSAIQAAQRHPGSDADGILKAISVWMPDRGSNRMFLTYFPWTLASILPIVAAFFAFRAVRERRGARAVNRAMYATMAGAFLCLPLLQFFLPTVIAVAVAGWQVRRAELTALRQAGLVDTRGRPIPQGDGAGGGAGGSVIEADVVDDADVGGAAAAEAGELDAGVVDAEVIEAEVAPVDDGDDGQPVQRPSSDTLLGRLRGGTSGSGDAPTS